MDLKLVYDIFCSCMLPWDRSSLTNTKLFLTFRITTYDSLHLRGKKVVWMHEGQNAVKMNVLLLISRKRKIIFHSERPHEVIDIIFQRRHSAKDSQLLRVNESRLGLNLTVACFGRRCDWKKEKNRCYTTTWSLGLLPGV